MLIIGSFEQSIELEHALAELENSSISRDHILVCFMDKDQRKHKYQPHGPHIFEIGIACSTGFAVIGASVGFILTWGPIIWGILTALIGFGIGCLAYTLVHKHRRRSGPPIKNEVTVIIQCSEVQSEHVLDVLWNHHALAVGQV